MERISHWLAWGTVVLTLFFAALNWSELSANTEIDFAVMQVQAPMGVILLGLTALCVALFFIATLYSRVSNLLETRRLHKEVRAAQDIADKAEASRLADLQHLILTEFRMLNERLNRLEAAVGDNRTPLVKLQ